MVNEHWLWWCWCSVISDSLRPSALYPTRCLCPRNCLGKNTGVGGHFLLQGIFSTQGSHPLLTSPALVGGCFTTVGFNLKSSNTSEPNKRFVLSSLKPNTDFSSLATEVLDGYLLPWKAAWSTLKNSLLLYHPKMITQITALSNAMKL